MKDTRNVYEVGRGLAEPWKPVVLAEVNGFAFKVVALQGEFPWHAHEGEDELFLGLEGAFRIEIEGAAAVELGAGDIYVVPAGTRHRPVARERAVAAVLERAETRQYGDMPASGA
jgi:mannose-6-phosphate isomerase-like protein (cupin superfamily)